MGRSITNDAHPEANMLGAASDKEVVGLLESFPPASEGLAAGPEPIGGLWGEHQLLRAANVSVVVQPMCGAGALRLLDNGQCQHPHPKDHAQLHKFYELGHGGFSALWARFVRDHAAQVGRELGWAASHMERGDDGSISFSIKSLSIMHHRFARWGALPESGLTPAEQKCTVLLPLNVDVMKSVDVQGVSFSVGDWVLARPNAANGDLGVVLDVQGGGGLRLPRHGVPNTLWFGKTSGVARSCER